MMKITLWLWYYDGHDYDNHYHHHQNDNFWCLQLHTINSNNLALKGGNGRSHSWEADDVLNIFFFTLSFCHFLSWSPGSEWFHHWWEDSVDANQSSPPCQTSQGPTAPGVHVVMHLSSKVFPSLSLKSDLGCGCKDQHLFLRVSLTPNPQPSSSKF